MLYLLMPGTRCSLREALLCPGCQQQKRSRQRRRGEGRATRPKLMQIYIAENFSICFLLYFYMLCFALRFVSFRFLLSFIRRRRQQPAAQRQRPFRRTRLPSGDCPAFAAHALCPQLATGKHFVFRLHNLAIFVP